MLCLLQTEKDFLSHKYSNGLRNTRSVDLGRDVDSEFPKPKRSRKKKADTKMNELEDNDVQDKRERLVACVLSGNSKMYLGKEYSKNPHIRTYVFWG